MEVLPRATQSKLGAAIVVAFLVVAAGVPAGVGATTGATGEQPTELTISEIQTPTGDGDASPHAGENVTTTGVVTATNEDGFYVQNGTGAYSGVFVYGSADVAAGDEVEVTGLVKEYDGLTEIDITTSVGNVATTGSGDVPAPTAVSTANASAEAYEGVLVEVTDLTVTSAPGEYGEWGVSDGSGEVRVDNVDTGDATTPDTTGGTIDSLTGPLAYNFGEFKIQPSTVENYTAPPADDPSGPSNGTTLTVLSYNDIQTAASDPTAMGRLVGAVNERRTAHDNPTVVVGGGDQVSPSSLSPVSNWTVPIQTLNVLDPAAEVVGNHDLDYGFEPVEDFAAASEFPWLVANIQQEDGGNIPGTKNYTVVERGNVTVGVVGLVDDAIKSKTAVDFDEQGYEVTDFVAAGDRIATELKTEQNVDVVVAAAHIGVPESEELARNSDHIDVVVTGDDEVQHPPETVSGTVVMEAEARAAYLGEANLTVTEDGTSLDSGRLVTVDDRFPVNETAEQTVADARGKYLSQVAGKTNVTLDSRFDSNYAEDTTWGNIIGDSFLAQTDADVAVTNAGGIRGDFVIDPGNVTYDDVYTSLPFGNYLVTKELTGEQLTELLASQVTTLDANYGAQAQLQVSGVTYEFVDRPGAETAVTDVYVQGEPVQPDETYNVTLNSYMAGWTFGDRYGWNVTDRPTVSTDYTLYGTAAIEYVEANSPLTAPGEDRIRRVTTTVGNASVSSEGDSVVLTYDVPSSVQSVNASTVHVENETSGTVYADDATLSGGTLTVTVDAARLESLADASDTLELYATYADSSLDDQRNGFDRSVLNGNVPTDVSAGADSGVALTLGDERADGAVPLVSGTELPVLAENVTDGVGAYNLTVEVGDGDVVSVEGFEPTADAALRNVTVSPDGDRVHVAVALADTAQEGTVELGTVELSGTALGQSATVSATGELYDENGSAYGSAADGGVLDVTPGDLTGNGAPMADRDGDGQYEDVNGDDSVDVVDAQALFAERDDEAVSASAPAFDFNGDGHVDVGDVQTLFATLAA